MKQTILFITETAEIGGAEIVIDNLAKLLQSYNFIPIVIVPSNGSFAQRLRKHNIAVNIVTPGPFATTSVIVFGRKLPNPFGLIISLFGALIWTYRLRRHFQSIGASIVHTNSLWAHLCGGLAARQSKKPIIWHYHSIVDPSAGFGLYYRLVKWAASRIPDLVVAVSERVRQQPAFASVPQAKLTTIENTVDLDRFRPENNHLLHGKVTIGTVSRLTHWKGQDIALKVATKLKAAGMQFRWIFVGDTNLGSNSYQRSLLDQVAENDLEQLVEFVGWVDDMPRLYQGFDIFVHLPTEPDPNPLVITEALASGLPIILTDNGGASHWVEDAGGTLVEPYEVDAVATTLSHWIVDPEVRQKIAKATRNYAEQQFNPQNYVAQWIDIYQAMETT